MDSIQVFNVALEVLLYVLPDASLYFLACILYSSFQVPRKQPRCHVPVVWAHIWISKWNDFLPFLWFMTSSLHFCKSFLISHITFICQLLHIILYHNCISVAKTRDSSIIVDEHWWKVKVRTSAFGWKSFCK